MSEFILISLHKIIFQIGYIWFTFFKKTPKYSYFSMRKLYYLTGGTFHFKKNTEISSNHKLPLQFQTPPFSDIILTPNEEKEHILKEIKENGFYIFKELINDSIVEDLKSFALTTSARLMPYNVETFEKYIPENPKAIKYQFSEGDLINNHTIQKIVSDKTLLTIAQNFLNAPPILDLVTMWWSTSINQEANSQIAQMYHYDMDRLKFLKFFIYLTDVTPETGPHCYVKGSNGHLPREIQTDGRYTDDLIRSIYGEENLLEICGKKGTLIAVDTSGIHKGKLLENNDRLIFQIEFTNSLFGHNNIKVKGTNYSDSFLKLKETHTHLYSRYI